MVSVAGVRVVEFGTKTKATAWVVVGWIPPELVAMKTTQPRHVAALIIIMCNN